MEVFAIGKKDGHRRGHDDRGDQPVRNAVGDLADDAGCRGINQDQIATFESSMCGT
jgi:hypothetical protein